MITSLACISVHHNKDMQPGENPGRTAERKAEYKRHHWQESIRTLTG